MNFSFGIIISVGVLAAISIALIAMSPDHILEPRVMTANDAMPESENLPAIIEFARGSAVPGCETNNECFLPYEANITAGTTVIWDNIDSAGHTATSTNNGEIGNMFNSGLLLFEDTFEYTFNDVGTFEYLCIVHPWMVGIINVS